MYINLNSNVFLKLPTNTVPRIQYANNVTPPAPFTHFRRTPEEYIIYYIVEGNMFIEENGVKYSLKENEMLLLSPEYEHIGFKGSYVKYYYIHFTLEGITEVLIDNENLKKEMMDFRTHIISYNSELLKSKHEEKQDRDNYKNYILFPKYVSFDNNTRKEALKHIKQMQEYLHTDKEYYNQMTGLKLMEFFIRLSRQITDLMLFNYTTNADRTVISLIDYLKENYHENLSSKEISDTFNLNYDYLNRNFKKVTGKTIFLLLNEIRIAKSKELLLTRKYSNAEIAQMTGFCNEYYFSRVFKKYTGMSAKKYVKNYYYDN